MHTFQNFSLTHSSFYCITFFKNWLNEGRHDGCSEWSHLLGCLCYLVACQSESQPMPFPVHHSVNTPGKAADVMAQLPEFPWCMWEIWMESLAPGFHLVQLQLCWPFEKWTCRWEICLCYSFFLCLSLSVAFALLKFSVWVSLRRDTLDVSLKGTAKHFTWKTKNDVQEEIHQTFAQYVKCPGM